MDQDFNDYEHQPGVDSDNSPDQSAADETQGNAVNQAASDGTENTATSEGAEYTAGDRSTAQTAYDRSNENAADDHSTEQTAYDRGNENAADEHSTEQTAYDHSAENTAYDHSTNDTAGSGSTGNQHFYEYYEVKKDQGSSYHMEDETPSAPEPPRKKKGSGWGRRIGTAIVVAVVFGLVAGIVFRAVNLVRIPGLDDNTQSATVENVEVSSVDEDTAGETVEESGSTESSQTSSGTMSVAEIAATVMPSVVAITTVSVEEFYDFFGGTQQYEGIGSGSGIIIGQNDDELLVATNNHVVADSTDLNVSFYGDELNGAMLDSNTSESASELAAEYAENSVPAQIKGTDEENDLAVVAVKKEDIPEETMAEIKVATMAAPDDVVVGEQVVAIGNALGYGQSVTSGYVSALDRTIESEDDYDYDYGYGYGYGSDDDSTAGTMTSGLIQTDAAINPGNSGGALLNMKGEVIGINSAKFADATVEGMGFAIPISTAEPILSDLMTREVREKVSDANAAYLGITCKEVSEEASEMYRIPTGAFVYEVMEGSAAEKGGILAGDVIVKMEDASISSYEDLVEELSYYEAGETVSIVVERANNGVYEEQTLSVTLGSKKDAE